MIGKHLLIGLVLLCTCLVQQVLGTACNDRFSKLKNEQAAKEAVKEIVKSKEKISTECLEILMRKAMFTAAYMLIEDYFLVKHIDVVDTVRMIATQMRKEVDNMLSLVTHKRELKVVQPVLYWAQGEFSVIMQIKFAHRFDSPGCNEVKNEHIKLKTDGLFLTGYCVQAHQPMLFKLNFTFFGGIIPEVSYWKWESVGRLFMNVSKIDPEIWPRLLMNPEEVSKSNIQVWWEMKKFYAADMDKFSQLLEDEESKKDKEKDDKRSKKKKRNAQKRREREEREAAAKKAASEAADPAKATEAPPASNTESEPPKDS